MSAPATRLRLIEGGKTEQGTALPETIELARALARLHFAAMMQRLEPDSETSAFNIPALM